MLKIQPSLNKVFKHVYEKNLWGGPRNKFYSGPGSHDPAITKPYINKIIEFSELLSFQNKKFLDIGCGDFAVGKQIAFLSSEYIGIDIVPDLIKHNQNSYSNDKINFFLADAVTDTLPDADVCFLRQILQHLTNTQIKKILKKISKYKLVFITEHLPTDANVISKNTNKLAGGNIRLDFGSGIFLNAHPFNLPNDQIKEILRCNLKKTAQTDPGTIVTFLYTPF